ncbi:MAG: hypothetical protein AAFR93_10035, partial [Pseudomonadota bacterium]
MDALSPHLGGPSRPPPSDLAHLCAALLDGIATPDEAKSRWAAACALVSAYPDQEAPQVAAAQVLELQRGPDSLLETWTALHRRFPQNRLALRMALRWLARAGRRDDASALIEAACLKPATTV